MAWYSPSVAAGAARAWAGRLGWLAGGGLIGAAIMSLRAPVPLAMPVATDTDSAACPSAVVPICPDSALRAPSIPAPPTDVFEPPRKDSETAPKASPAPKRPPKPTLKLPRMPGTNQLRAGTKWDQRREAWALTFAYEIPAARAQVSTFYRKVLEDADLVVDTSEGAPDEQGAVPLYLKGRNTAEHAHVTVRQSVDDFETRVRVIWRFYERATP
ncbi:MAG: hypothetical protein KUG77_23970 [Nannocystaceae bacterium]|nr:hypothetical protein [Nannocystaceae bacterium]